MGEPAVGALAHAEGADAPPVRRQGRRKRTDAKRRAETDALAKAAKVRSVWFSPGHHDLHLEFPERVADILDGAVRDGFFA